MSVDARFVEDGWLRLSAGRYVAYVWLPPPDRAGQAWSHGHADAGQVTLFRAGVPILVDPGQASYGSDPVARYGTEATAHNVPVLDAVGASPGRRARYRSGYRDLARWQLESAPGDSPVRLRFDGFRRVYRDVVWRRCVALGADRVTIEDAFEGSGYHVLDSYFHVAGTVARCAPRRLELTAEDGTMIELVQAAGDARRTVWENARDMRHGWCWPAYGQARPCTTARFRHIGGLARRHRFVIGDAGCAE